MDSPHPPPETSLVISSFEPPPILPSAECSTACLVDPGPDETRAARLDRRPEPGRANAASTLSLSGWEAAVLGGERWYCVRSQPKHEHIAAANLRRHLDVDVFNPRFRYRKSTQRGPVWTVEPVFPGYLFARFDLTALLERVKYAGGVSTVVHFGNHIPILADATLVDLRAAFGSDETQEVEEQIELEREVTITAGTFCGLPAVVLRALPASRRVRVLIEFLGQSARLDLPYEHLAPIRGNGNMVALRG